MEKRRVVVTGVGLVTPLGNKVNETWSALIRGESGVDYISRFDAELYPVRFAAEVKNFNALDFVEKKEARKMGTFTHYAIAASDEALEDSKLVINERNSETVGTFISSGIGDFWGIEREHAVYLKDGPRRVSPFFIPSVLANMAAGLVSIRHGAKGPNSATATACAAGAHAIGESFEIIQRGDADVMICGGAESAITPMSVAGFAAMRAMSTRNDDPQRASRPFDCDRDGFVIGEGAGIMILEELESAVRRGAPIYAEIVGYGMTSDAFHMTQPDSSESGGITRVMLKALKDAAIEPEAISYINAHATSTPIGDRVEIQAIKNAFGKHAQGLAISSTKSMTGHLLGGAGGIESVFTVLSLHHQRLPPTINYSACDVGCDLDFVPNSSRSARVDYALTNNFGFGGTNASLIFKRYEG
jgi:3-oxoacyl-[acyl-carrier-protein] synthase II